MLVARWPWSRRAGLGTVSPEAYALAAQLGAQIVQKAPSGEFLYFPQPVEYEFVLPTGARLSADAISYSLAMSDPGTGPGIVQSMLMTRAAEQGMNLPEAVMASRAAMPEGSLPPLSQLATTPGYVWPSSQVTAAATTTTTAYSPRVALTNLSRPGQTATFAVGDRWTLSIAGGPPNAVVRATAVHDGRSSTSEMGRTDGAGFFQLSGQMSEAEIGAWEQTWTVGGVEASPRLRFQVQRPTSTAITTTYYPRVAQTNLSRPGAADFQVGDRWTLSIAGGPPNAVVRATAVHDGRSSTSEMGRTDGAGVWQTTGQMSEAEIGAWEQTWTVGGVEASPRLRFQVQAAAPTAAKTQAQPPNAVDVMTGPGYISPPADWWAKLREIPWYVWVAAAGGLLLMRRA